MIEKIDANQLLSTYEPNDYILMCKLNDMIEALNYILNEKNWQPTGSCWTLKPVKSLEEIKKINKEN